MSKLIIVESPSKAKTISKIVGKEYDVIASNGHVVDLPKNKLGIDVDNNFEASYLVVKSREKIVNEIKKRAKGCKEIFLASDPDREGEAIAKNIADILNLKGGKIRIEFNEITEKAIKKAIANPREIDINKVNAQQARRLLDRLVGYQISPLLWKKLGYSTSAGRVQSVSLKLICELEDSIKAFVPEKFWKVEGIFGKDILLALHKIGEEKVDKVKDKKKIENIEDSLGKEFEIVEYLISQKKSSPPLPFKTSSLQQSASSLLGYSPSRTMRIAQSIYDGVSINGNLTGLITYMRTDSTRISQDAKEDAKKYILGKFGDKYHQSRGNAKDKKNIQDAHEGIRPTSILREPLKIKSSISEEQFKIYNLIYNRFLASQMSDMIYDQLELEVKRGIFSFRSLFNKITFDGFFKIQKDGDKGYVSEFPKLEKNSKILLNNLEIDEEETKPPARLSEASLIKKLEKEGIGRPSTYASIVETLKKREYVNLEKKRFVPTNLGYSVKDSLNEHFPNIMNVKFTSEMEKSLDDIALGDKEKEGLLKSFYLDLKKYMDEFKKKAEQDKGKKIGSDVPCNECNEPMFLKTGRFGKYLECENKHKVSVPEGAVDYEDEKKGFVKVKEVVEEEIKKRGGIPTDVILEGCDKKAVLKEGPYGNYLECINKEGVKVRESLPKSIKLEKDNLNAKELSLAEQIKSIKDERSKIESESKPCDKCGNKMLVRDGKYGPFISCSGYPKCKNMKKYPNNT